MITKTRSTDQFGNVYYAVSRDGQSIGQVDKACTGYQATLPNGSYVPASSIKKAIEILSRYAA